MPQPAAPAGSVGHRLAAARELAGLTRRQLADRAQLSPGVLAGVERGDLPASPALTAAAARALSLDVETLHGQPYGAALCDPNEAHAGVPALRAALFCADDPQPPGPPLTPTQLRARLNDCEHDRTHARYAQVNAALPDLLHHAHALAAQARPGTEAETAAALVTDACLLAHTIAYRFGYLDLAMLCHSHARTAAATSGDPLRMAVVAGAHTQLRLHRGDYPGAQQVLDQAQTTIADQHSPAADAVRVHLHLRQALTHARNGTADQADQHIDTARDLITQGIPPSPYHTVQASPAAVDMCWIAVAVDLTDPATALDRASMIKIPTGEPPALIGRHLIDLARAHTLTGDHDQALDALHQARATAPQLVRYHPQAHEITHHLAETQRRNTDSLPGFARWLGTEPSPDAE